MNRQEQKSQAKTRRKLKLNWSSNKQSSIKKYNKKENKYLK